MESLFETKRMLSVSIGEGYLSAYELSVLKPGDLVVTEKLAGEGYSVYLDGDFVLAGEIVIITDVYGVRVTSLAPPKPGSGVPSNSDEVIEMLPFKVRLAEIEVSLGELKGAGVGTIINFGKPYSDEQDAELVVCGIPIAAGKVIATYENMGLRIMEVYGKGEAVPGLAVRSSGNLREKAYQTKYTKDYNFKRPDKFSRNAIDMMSEIHSLFVRNLRMQYDVFGAYELHADQMTFGEFLQEADVRTHNCLLLHNRPWPREFSTEHDAGMFVQTAPSTYYVEPEGISNPISAEHREFIRKLVTGEGQEMLNGVFLFISKSGPVSRFSEDEKQREFLLASLRGAWKNIVSMNFQISRITDRMDEIKVIHENEMVLTLSVRAKDEGSDLMHIVYPYLTLHPYVGVLN